MKRIIIAGLLALTPLPAFAQSAANVGFQVTPTEYETLVKYLSDKPYATVAPVLAWLDNKEHAAQTQAHAAEMKAKAPKPNIVSPIPTFNGKPSGNPNLAPSTGK